MQIVSYVNSSPSMNSSTFTSSYDFTCASARSSSSALPARIVSIDPAPAIGFTMTGNPISLAASRTWATVVAEAWRAVRMPAATTFCFIRSLLRKACACATRMPGAPNASRSLAARTTPGSHRQTTRSIFWPPTPATTARTTASSSVRLGTRR